MKKLHIMNRIDSNRAMNANEVASERCTISLTISTTFHLAVRIIQHDSSTLNKIHQSHVLGYR